MGLGGLWVKATGRWRKNQQADGATCHTEPWKMLEKHIRIVKLWTFPGRSLALVENISRTLRMWETPTAQTRNFVDPDKYNRGNKCSWKGGGVIFCFYLFQSKSGSYVWLMDLVSFSWSKIWNNKELPIKSWWNPKASWELQSNFQFP